MSIRSMSCSECRLLIGGYILDALEPDEAALVECHLESCEACARERHDFASLPILLDLAGDDFARTDPPGALEEAVLDRFAREHRARRRRPLGGLADRLRASGRLIARPLPAALGGALAAGALALGIALATSGGAGSETYQAHLAALPGAPGATANARLVTFAQGTHVQLAVSGLRGDPSAIYELWCVRDDGAKVSGGTFRVDRNGRANVALTAGVTPQVYHRLSVERERVTATGWTGVRVLAGSIEYH